jgi:AcrR family transcriptional regulator
MNIHSVPTPLLARAKARSIPSSVPGAKREAILRAATDVFADRGFFNAQVADVARAAGVAAGTVYLYFRSKDDLLVSIFEKTMREGLAEGRQAAASLPDPAERLRHLARLHLARLGRDRNLAIVFQVELRQSTKFKPQRHGRGENVFRRARRNGDQLDSQPAASAPRSGRRPRRRSVRERRARPLTLDQVLLE